MDDAFEPSEAPPAAGLAWICVGLALLAASPFVPATQVGWVSVAVAAIGFMLWTHAANPTLEPTIYTFQVLVFNIPLVAWWLSLTSVIPISQWLAPAIATAAVGCSFSVGAGGLYIWLMYRPRRMQVALLVAAIGLLGTAAVLIFQVSQGQGDALAVFAALATTLAILLQRLLALPFDDDLLGWRTKFMALAGSALLIAYVRGLLPATPDPALVYGGTWLLAGSLFTILASLISEARA